MKVDLRHWCSPVRNQLDLRTCTALSATSLIEYLHKKNKFKIVDYSSLFIYKTARNILGLKGDTGLFPHNVVDALSLYGVPYEIYFPYTFDGKNVNPNWDVEFHTDLYKLAKKNIEFKFVCHDPISESKSPVEILQSVKEHLSMGIPSMFCYYGFPSNQFSNILGGIAFPSEKEFAIYAHSLSVFGYDDKVKINNTQNNIQTIGALLIKNSRGLDWGDQGYGWLPYEYILKNLAKDFWSLI